MKYSELSESDIKFFSSSRLGPRDLNVLKLREEGKTLKEIGITINRSATLVRCIILKLERRFRQRNGFSIYDLPSRQYHVLKRAGLLDDSMTEDQLKQKIKTAVLSGHLTRNGYKGEKILNYGMKSFLALLNYSGLTFHDYYLGTARKQNKK